MIGLLFSTSLLISASSYSKSAKKVSASSAAIQPSVRYVGDDNAGSFFEVRFNGETAVKFDLTIVDENGNLLYNQAFEATTFSKYIKFVN